MQFDCERARQHMVDGQLKTNGIVDGAIVDAFLTVPREEFVPRSLTEAACRDEDLSLPDGGFLMEPLALARLVDGAKMQSSDVVLVLGCCTGYTSAIMSRMASSVIALVTAKDLEAVRGRFDDQEIANAVAVESADLSSGAASDGPYDVIIIPGAVEHVPEVLLDQLSSKGRLVTIRRSGRLSHAVCIRKVAGQLHEDILADCWAPMLEGFAKKPEFTF